MVIQFEAPDGSVIERLEQTHISSDALPRAITADQGWFWLVGVLVAQHPEYPYLAAYRLAREISSAMH